MAIADALKHVGHGLHADVEDEGTRLAFELTLARRKTTMELRILRYRIGLEIDEEQQTVFFEEMLWERPETPGVALDAAFRGQEEAYRVAARGERGLEAQSLLFSQKYKLQFDFPGVRRRLREACKAEGYELRRLIPLEEE